MHSIEGAYIALSRLLIAHWNELGWWPVWYLGIPWQNSYPPVLHVTVAGVAALSGISTALAHHIVAGLAYSLGPVCLYWLALRIGASQLPATLAALFYSVLSPSIWLIPDVRHDVAGLLYPRRFHTLIYYGEGPHVASMTLLLVALIVLDFAMQRKGAWRWFLAAVAMAVVVLTNWLGGFALAAGVLAVLFARDHSVQARLAVIATGIWAYLLAAPWIPPTTLMAVRTNAQRVGGAYGLGLQHIVYALVAAALFALILRLVSTQQPLVRFTALFTFLIGGITLVAEYFGVALLPQPERYHLEMEIGLALAAGLVLAAIFARARGRPVWVLLSLLAIFVAACQVRVYARELIGAPIDISQTVEYQAARWFDSHMGGRRVLAPGSIGFWMNTWTDTPQLMGGFDQGITNNVLPAAHFQVYSGLNAGEYGPDLAVGWLQVYGVHAVGVGGPQSRETFRPFRSIERFAGLRELWRNGDDVIYQVPQRATTLAWLMPPDHLVRKPVEYANNLESIQPYLNAIRVSAEPLPWQWISWNHAQASGLMTSDRVISIQMSYHPGWEASVNGQQIPIRKDELGLMYVDPRCGGSCEVVLRYTGGREMQVARAAHYGAAGFGLASIVWALVRRRRK
jgi:hypothetical protein